jgi:hypothetical protein
MLRFDPNGANLKADLGGLQGIRGRFSLGPRESPIRKRLKIGSDGPAKDSSISDLLWNSLS